MVGGGLHTLRDRCRRVPGGFGVWLVCRSAARLLGGVVIAAMASVPSRAQDGQKPLDSGSAVAELVRAVERASNQSSLAALEGRQKEVISERNRIAQEADRLRDQLLAAKEKRAALLRRGRPSGATTNAHANRLFSQHVRPVLLAACLHCHGGKHRKAGLDVSTREALLRGGDTGPAILPGNAADSLLYKLVTHQDEPAMPHKKDKLPDAVLARIADWINAGAPYDGPLAGASSDAASAPDHWSYRPVTRPPLPATRQSEWVANPVDTFVLARLEAKGLSPSPPADRITLIRRLSADLLGLPPTPEAIDAFVSDRRPDAWPRLVDRMLASPRYGERWARHWLDVVRFAETNGFETNTPRPNAWPYRDYVIRAFNRDKPYGQFVLEQLAGDSRNADAATGFLVGGPYDTVKSPDINLTLQQRMDELHDMISTTGSAFLGLTVGCARCHSHKFDPVTQADYYAMQAVFAGVKHGQREFRTPENEDRIRRLAETRKRLAAVTARLSAFELPVYPGRTILIDDETVGSEHLDQPSVTLLQPKAGHGQNPAGTQRGYADDPGSENRLPNIGRRYTWWHKMPNTDVMTWAPKTAGRFRVWLSWGAGWDSHAKDAQFLLDGDGNLETRDDPKLLLRADQQHFADGSGQVVNKALWSGLYDAGVHDFDEASRIVLRSGASDAPVTADILVLQETVEQSGGRSAGLPRLRAPVHPLRNLDRFGPVEARFVRFTILATNQSEPCIDELAVFTAGENPRNVALASAGARASASSVYPNNPLHRLEHINDGQYGNKRSWIPRETAGAWVQIAFDKPYVIDTVAWARDRLGDYTDRLATRYRIDVAVEPGKWIRVASSDDRRPFVPGKPPAGNYTALGKSPEEADQLKKLLAEQERLKNREAELGRVPRVYAGTFEQPGPTHRLHRGEAMQTREEVTPGAIAAIGGPLRLPADTPECDRRLALARWITDPANPLPARVMVNRIWQHHFGAGIVDTPSDFGANGSRPTHPRLLDWLASEFTRTGGSVKAIHRLILLSNTYRQSSAPNAEALTVDAAGRFLWRYPPHRLEAEVIRDSILQLAGTLDLRMGGPGYNVFEPNDNYVRVYNPKTKFDRQDWRRMVYQHKVRMEPDATFGAFDCPDAGQVCPKRTRSTTALQALNLLNSPFILQQADIFADRLRREAGGRSADQVVRAFRLAFGRRPDSDERDSSVSLIESHGLSAFCRAMFNANEFLFIQ